ncbi:unnamed protein product [Cuscuta europaea]|uniref:Uncharacterized protein n=1 Tax=Cuscuta europaea TaxID=41803 RepID=A0A9P0ZUT3_CUSEU|nr:unnamed protein product [Cuscuta europaea]
MDPYESESELALLEVLDVHLFKDDENFQKAAICPANQVTRFIANFDKDSYSTDCPGWSTSNGNRPRLGKAETIWVRFCGGRVLWVWRLEFRRRGGHFQLSKGCVHVLPVASVICKGCSARLEELK